MYLTLVTSLTFPENTCLQEDPTGTDLPHILHHPTQLWSLDGYNTYLLLRVWRAPMGHCPARHEVFGVWSEVPWKVSGPPECRLFAEWVLRWTNRCAELVSSYLFSALANSQQIVSSHTKLYTLPINHLTDFVDPGSVRFLRISTWSLTALDPSRKLQSDFQSVFLLSSHNSPTWSVGTCKVMFLTQRWCIPEVTAAGILFQACLTSAFYKQAPCSSAAPVQTLKLGGHVSESQRQI